MKVTGRYRYWDIFDEIPEGWSIDKTAGSPAPNTVFITNGKSVLNGQKRAMLTVKKEYIETEAETESLELILRPIDCVETIQFPAKTVNELARLKFQEQILKDILVDLTICEIEGWNKREYINQLKSLIDSIDCSKTGQQLSLF